MFVYKIESGNPKGDATWVAADNIQSAILAIPDWDSYFDVEAFPLQISICEPDEMIEVHCDYAPPASHCPSGKYHYDEGLGVYVIADTAMSWADWAEATGEAQAFSAERWAP